MSDIIFPVLSKPPADLRWSLQDLGISSQMMDGGDIGRARFTKPYFAKIEAAYSLISYADKETIEQFYQTVIRGSAQQFLWTCPDPQSGYYQRQFLVRMIEPPAFNRVPPGYWSGSIVMRGAVVG